ncbi:MAG: hypothetical protein WC025_01215 [Candidatus Magasanikbacteria bacterium]
MFDDNIPNNSNQVPSNLPITEPEDIFSSISNDDVSPSNPIAPVKSLEPIVDNNDFAMNLIQPLPSERPVNSALGVGVLKPKVDDMFDNESNVDNSYSRPPSTVQPTNYFSANNKAPVNNNTSNYNTVLPPPGVPSNESRSKSVSQLSEPVGNKKVIVWIIVLAVLVILGSGSAWIYFSFIKDSTNNNVFISPSIQENTTTPSVENNPITLPVVDNTQENNATTTDLNKQIIVGEPLDTDADGLDDIRESSIGTDPLNWDTDSDGLSDGDEVIIWKTDPLDVDTDNDGFKDGEEIKNGYSPTGPGKLFETPVPENSISVTSSTALVQ